jgi:hypothetical protein
MKAETNSFSRSLTTAVNQLADGQAPRFFGRFLPEGYLSLWTREEELFAPYVAETRYGDWWENVSAWQQSKISRRRSRA